MGSIYDSFNAFQTSMAKSRLNELAKGGDSMAKNILSSGANVTQSGNRLVVSGGMPGGSTPASSNSQVQALAADWQKQMDAANAANQALRSQIEGGYAKMEGDVLGTIAGRYDQAKQDVAASADAMRARNKSGLARLGMYNTTNQVALDRAATQDQDAEMRRLAASEAGEKAGVIERSRQSLLNFQNTINQQGPNGEMLASLLERYGSGLGGQAGLDSYQSSITNATRETSGQGARVNVNRDYLNQFSSDYGRAKSSTKTTEKPISYSDLLKKMGRTTTTAPDTASKPSTYTPNAYISDEEKSAALKNLYPF